MNEPKPPPPPSKNLRLRLDVSGFIAPWLKADIERDPAGFVEPVLGTLPIAQKFSVTLVLEDYDDGPILAVHGAELPASFDIISKLFATLEAHIVQKLDPLRPCVLFYGEWR